MRFGVALGALNTHFHLDATAAAEALGYESVWLPEHLVFPATMSKLAAAGEEEHPPVPPTTPVFDAFAYLAFLAGRVPDRAARYARLQPRAAAPVHRRHAAVQTLDIVSGGRCEFGIGASWLEEEWVAVGLDFATRGRRVDEVLAVCKRLWTEPDGRAPR